MIADRIDLLKVEMPLKSSFVTSFGVIEARRFGLVRVGTAEGLVGWGEIATLDVPLYDSETTDTALLALRDYYAPLVLGRRIESVPDLLERISPVRGQRYGRAALEAAWWDMVARRDGLPLYKLLGGVSPSFDSGVSIGIIEPLNRLVEEVETFLRLGYKRIKIKIKPGWDLSAVARIREELGDIPLMVDANSSYKLADAPLLRELDRFGLMMIEQPFGPDDLVDHACLQADLETPVCLDESIKTIDHLRAALQLGSCRVLNIKPARVGGLSNAVRLHDICRAADVPVWCGGMLESGIGRAFNAALSTLPGFSYPGDISSSSRYYEQDIVEPPLELEDGSCRLPDVPGTGFRPVERLIESVTVDRVTLKPD